MSLLAHLTHTVLIAHPDPTASPDATGQLFVDETGQPIGDATANAPSTDGDWMNGVSSRALIQEKTAHWPSGPGAGPELVDTLIFLPTGTAVRELDKIKRTDIDPVQVYQAVFVHDAAGQGHHLEVQARRVPL